MSKNTFNKVNNSVNFIELEHEMLKKWEEEDTSPWCRFDEHGCITPGLFDIC